ncbi:MAG: threonine aldolase [Flavobacteriales bacterium]|nr:threonine aldolase [Flavobacteriia bacterium]NCP06512.1 threonine aldolase [Flavobacteriales bacterium]PIV92952.1 MAG: threonine aldolase [Flavobacteriaceae bacterium CG17_big_fil_post_rev_8_21_14_2_50_33_15]PIY11849.1 MAG: threonine aldolase [Flavobacteriaceae bacterium CG_4_10_14_3_um_filter_33_47]PJB20699.1 MAG: threonine aldolase [Flavobacteriaceae bacterium CG_4_9_14_3_um_filter_33_16]
MTIDLRSDTVTKPTPPMLEAMMQAKVGDDVFSEDPTVNALEERISKMFGKSRALFFPSGTMANQTAIKLHTNPGEQVICDKYAHIYHYESGGASFNSGVSCRLLDGNSGMFTANQVKEAINPDAFYYSQTSLVEIENTTNKGGGACWDFKEILKIKEVCASNNLGFHLDGARLWNALVVKNETTQDYGKVFDTICVCLSKGLGCPVGSVLVGDETIMKNAIRVRKIFGGNMRQVGYLAAAGLYALDHHIDRLKEDHKKAKEIGSVLAQASYIKSVEPIETNIIIFELNAGIDENTFTKKLKDNNIHIIGMGGGKLRMVTHLDYTNTMHDYVLSTLKGLKV